MLLSGLPCCRGRRERARAALHRAAASLVFWLPAASASRKPPRRLVPTDAARAPRAAAAPSAASASASQTRRVRAGVLAPHLRCAGPHSPPPGVPSGPWSRSTSTRRPWRLLLTAAPALTGAYQPILTCGLSRRLDCGPLAPAPSGACMAARACPLRHPTTRPRPDTAAWVRADCSGCCADSFEPPPPPSPQIGRAHV